MNRIIKIAAVLALVALAVTASGCAAKADAAGSGGMKLPKVWGYVAGARFAQLDVADQPGAKTLVVSRVLAPTNAWIVVHVDDNGMPGDRVGLKFIPKGESRDVQVPLEGASSERVIVAVHADKGTPNRFDFDMMKKLESPDRPFFVNEKELAKSVVVTGTPSGAQ